MTVSSTSSEPAFSSWPRLKPAQIHEMLDSSHEWAFLDVREQGVFDEGHPFWAVNMPFSHLESRMPRLVPRRGTRLVLMDEADDGLAARAAARLASWGYGDICLMEDGLRGWREAQLPVYAGIYVPSKAFGEFVEHRYGTPSIDPEEFRAWLDEGRDMVVLDSRPFGEFHHQSLPGGINCPGAELVSRIFDIVEDEHTTIVVNCAGRTRGLIGAQSLINAGIRNPVVTVRNGLAGWHLIGERMVEHNRRVAPPPTVEGTRRALAAAERVARRFGVRCIDIQALRDMQAQGEARTLYVFDVRSPEEFAAGHIPGAANAPGGQLVQSTDDYVGTRGARIVLCDDTGVRARMTASWLLQLGWQEVYVLEGGLTACGPALETGPEPALPALAAPAAADPIGVLALHAQLEAGKAVVLDLSDSMRFGAGHIPGAWFAVRARLQECAGRLPPHEMLVLTCPDGRFAELACADARTVFDAPVRVLRGGNRAWAQAGLPLETGRERLSTRPDDVWYSPYDRPDREAAIKAYLNWEIDLIHRAEHERGVNFRYVAAD